MDVEQIVLDEVATVLLVQSLESGEQSVDLGGGESRLLANVTHLDGIELEPVLAERVTHFSGVVEN